jgi:hypothetical protein
MDCPFNVVKQYLDALPDAYGSVRIGVIANDPTKEHLRFMRARHTHGNRRFLTTPLGMSFLYFLSAYFGL